jgi:hypothetical protein
MKLSSSKTFFLKHIFVSNVIRRCFYLLYKTQSDSIVFILLNLISHNMYLIQVLMGRQKTFLLLFIGMTLSLYIKAQTQGTLTFSTTLTSHSGRYGSGHVVAVWIENASGTFIKTRLVMAKSSHTLNNHLPKWKSNSNQNVVDATTGATLNSYSSPISIAWDATDISGNIVPDGTYQVWIEESWDEGSSGTSFTSISFVKGADPQNLSPANTAAFTNISLSWTPQAATTVFEYTQAGNSVIIYPNPSTGIVNIEFVGLTDVFDIQIQDINGTIIYYNQLGKTIVGTKQIDMSNFPGGMYFVALLGEDGRIILSRKLLIEH